MGTASQLGRRIRELRKYSNWSQEELAKRSGLTRPHVSKLERAAIQAPSAETLTRLANAFQVDPDELLAAAGLVSPKDEPDLNLLDPELRVVMRRVARLTKRDQRLILDIVRPILERERDEGTSGGRETYVSGGN